VPLDVFDEVVPDVLVEPDVEVLASSDELLSSDDDLLSSDDVLVEVVPVDVFVVAEAKDAVCVTPAIRPTVTAPAAAATPYPARVMRRWSPSAEGRLLMTTTMASPASGACQHNVKSVLSCAGNFPGAVRALSGRVQDQRDQRAT
jgi:hypothetical protein